MIIVSVGIGHICDIYEPDIRALSRLGLVRAAKPHDVGFGSGRS